MEIEKIITELEEFYRTKSFNTRGLPFSKKMWRDGYNKALQDILIHFKAKEELVKGTAEGENKSV